MALLSTSKRSEYFKVLGLGEYNKANILKFQKKYFTRKKDQDGLYGPDTDNLLRHCYNVKTYAGKNFKPEEFRCGCGRKYCTGYPTYMKPAELANLQTIRTHYGKPMEITSGLRCKGFNSRLRGSSANSKHLTGLAADFYIKGVTDTLARRKSAIAYIKKLPNFNWCYGNGWCSKGYKVSATNMGNALHLDSLNNSVSVGKPAPAATKTTAQKIAEKAVALAWPKGTAAAKYTKAKGGSATSAYKSAAHVHYPKVSNLTECHVYVGTVLADIGMVGMPVDKWTNIFKWLRKNFTELTVNYTQSQLKAGDIRIHKNSNGGYHIWIIAGSDGLRAEASHNNKFPHINPSNSGNVKKHKGDWLFRAK